MVQPILSKRAGVSFTDSSELTICPLDTDYLPISSEIDHILRQCLCHMCNCGKHICPKNSNFPALRTQKVFHRKTNKEKPERRPIMRKNLMYSFPGNPEEKSFNIRHHRWGRKSPQLFSSYKYDYLEYEKCRTSDFKTTQARHSEDKKAFDKLNDTVFNPRKLTITSRCKGAREYVGQFKVLNNEKEFDHKLITFRKNAIGK